VERIVGLTGVDRIVAAIERGGEKVGKRLEGGVRKLLTIPRTFKDVTVRVIGAPVRMPNGQTARGGGAGVLLVGTADSCLVGTAHHVVYDKSTGLQADGIQLELSDGRKYTGTLATKRDGGPAVDEEADAALLIAPIKAEPFSFFATEPPGPGDTLRICGFPKNGPWQMKQGKLQGVCPNCGETHTGEGRYTIEGVNAIPGDSGGPIIGTDGRVVGILSGSNWAKPHATPFSACASWEAIYALCRATDYPFPPILPWRRHVEGEILEIQQQLPIPDAPDVGYISAAVEVRVGKLEAKIATLESDLAALKAGQDKILEIAEAAKQAAAASGSDFGKAFGERLDELEEKNGSAFEKALAEAAAAKAAAEKVTEAVDEDRKTFGQRIKEFVGQLPVIKQVGQLAFWVKGLTWGGAGLVAGIAFGLFLLWRKVVVPDLNAFVKTAGKDPLLARQLGERLTDAIPGKWDDAMFDAFMDKVENRIMKMYGQPPIHNGGQAPAPQPPADAAK
jgi:hypothetical protein